MIWLLLYIILAVVSYGMINGHTFNDPIIGPMSVAIGAACMVAAPILFGVAIAITWKCGFKFRLKP